MASFRSCGRRWRHLAHGVSTWSQSRAPDHEAHLLQAESGRWRRARPTPALGKSRIGVDVRGRHSGAIGGGVWSLPAWAVERTQGDGAAVVSAEHFLSTTSGFPHLDDYEKEFVRPPALGWDVTARPGRQPRRLHFRATASHQPCWSAAARWSRSFTVTLFC